MLEINSRNEIRSKENQFNFVIHENNNRQKNESRKTKISMKKFS